MVGVQATSGGAGFWKACTLVLMAALAVLWRGAHPPAAGPTSEAVGLGQLQARVAALELTKSAEATHATQLSARVDRLEAGAAAWDELTDWREATRLGVTRALAKRQTGLTPRQETHLAATIVREARDNRLDPLLVAAVIQVESGFNPRAISSVGAVGVMQLMPATAVWLSDEPSAAREDGLFDFERNIHLGCVYLAGLIHQFGGVDAALLAYNMGPAAARKALGGARARTLLAGYPRKVEQARRGMARSQRGEARPVTVAAAEEVESDDAVSR